MCASVTVTERLYVVLLCVCMRACALGCACLCGPCVCVCLSQRGGVWLCFGCVHACVLVCVFVCACVQHICLQHVRDNPQAPHVCVERHKVVVDHFWSEELRGAKIHSQLLPGLISSRGTKV